MSKTDLCIIGGAIQDINIATKRKPEMWMYERRYTNVRHMTADMYTATIRLPNHSGLPPGFLHPYKKQISSALRLKQIKRTKIP